jgi:hypothetical protein
MRGADAVVLVHSATGIITVTASCLRRPIMAVRALRILFRHERGVLFQGGYNGLEVKALQQD